MVVQLLPQDVRAGGDGGRNAKRGGEGSLPSNLASREEGLLLVTYSSYCSQTVKQETPCALLSALCPCPTGQRGDSCGPFLL